MFKVAMVIFDYEKALAALFLLTRLAQIHHWEDLKN